jgi:multidrug efflux pump
MTTAATIAGHFPLILARGPGAGARNSIGIMLVSGMFIGTIFTLFVVPSIYMLVARKHSADPVDWDAETTVHQPEEVVA